MPVDSDLPDEIREALTGVRASPLPPPVNDSRPEWRGSVVLGHTEDNGHTRREWRVNIVVSPDGEPAFAPYSLAVVSAAWKHAADVCAYCGADNVLPDGQYIRQGWDCGICGSN